MRFTKLQLILKFVIISCLFIIVHHGCFPDRVPTEPDYKALDVRRPGVEAHVPLSDASFVNTNTTIEIWFDEQMDNSSIRDNFMLWPSVNLNSVDALVIDPSNSDVIYAAQAGSGIFKSDDGAEFWRWLTPGSMKMSISELAVSQDNSALLYAATTESGMYKSMDGGANWQPINDGLPEMNIVAMAVDPGNANIIYVATNANGIYRTEDGGQSWQAKNNGVRPTRSPQDIVINHLNSNIIYTATLGDFVLKSMDGGESWTRLRTGFFTQNFNTLAIHPQDTALVFALSTGGGIYRSPDSGNNWELIVDGLTSLNVNSIALDPVNNDNILIDASSILFRTLNGGDSWTSIGEIAPEISITSLITHPSEEAKIYAATTGGVYLSADMGNTWMEKSELPLDDLIVPGLFDFEFWQDTTVVISFLDSVTTDTTVMFPYIYDRALSAWISNGRQGDPPVEVNPAATQMIFTPSQLLIPNQRYQVRINGSFESDRETLKNSFGARDVNGNSIEVNRNFTFTTGDE